MIKGIIFDFDGVIVDSEPLYIETLLGLLCAGPFLGGFMGYFMNTSSFHNQLVPYMQGSKVLAISRTSIKQVPVRFPITSSEQHDIAQFFLTLDRLISLRARQLEKLKALKTGFLQKMFV